MSLTIDYITMPPKSQEVSQVQRGEQVKSDHANQQVASQFQEQVKHTSEQTIRREKAENQELRYDEKERKGKKGSGQKKDSQKKKQEESEDDSLSGGHRFDMRV